MSRRDDAESPPDVEIAASARARRLEFGQEPETDVKFRGRSDSATERENLPDEVKLGTTRKEVTVRWYARAWIDAQAHPDVKE